MKAEEYSVLLRAVEEGVQRGWNRAHKHTDKPTEDQMIEAMETNIMSEICEWFDFAEPEEDTLECEEEFTS